MKYHDIDLSVSQNGLLIRTSSIFIILFICISGKLKSQCNPVADSIALLNLYHSTDGPNWNISWDTTQPISSWYGIQLGTDGCVIEISLRYNALSGQIPDFSVGLEDLTRLDLSYNNLSGKIPNFPGLPNLESLELSHNQISDTIPNFTNLTNLRGFWAFGNNLSGKIPNFQNSPKLKSLNLNKNELYDSIPAFLQTPRLEYIDLSWNNLSGSIPGFDSLTNLIYLYLQCNQLSGPIPDFNLYSLEHINLSNNNLSGPFPNLINSPYIIDLYINSNYLSGTIPPLFPMLGNFMHLNLSENDFHGQIPDFFFREGELNSIFLNGNNFSGLLPEANDSMFNSSFGRIHIDDNKFTFSDLLSSPSLSRYNYGPYQKPIGNDTTLHFDPGEWVTLHLPIDSSLTTNTYRWYHNGTFHGETHLNTYNIGPFSPDKSGIYFCEITNANFPGLTLISSSFVLVQELNIGLRLEQKNGIQELLFDQISWGDFNGDGYFDLLAHGYGEDGVLQPTLLFQNKNGNSFEAVRAFSPPLPSGLRLRELHWIDYDRDSDLDIAYRDIDGKITVYSNEGFSQFFRIPHDTLIIPQPKGFSFQGDWDQNGFTDWLSEDGLALLSQRDNGSFQAIQFDGFFPSPYRNRWIDFDKNGSLDLVRYDNSSVSLFRIGADSINSVEILLPISGVNKFPSGVIIHDIDLDGYIDIGLSQGLRWNYWEQVNPYVFGLSDTSYFSTPNSFLTISDINLDGLNDFIKIEHSNQALLNISFQEQGGIEKFVQQIRLGKVQVSNPQWTDIDQDGDLDLTLIARDDFTRQLSPLFIRNITDTVSHTPTPPQNLSVIHVSTDSIELAWDPANDHETPSQALSYNVYISTRKGAMDRVSAKGNEVTGKRYIPHEGNAFQNNFYKLKGLTPGRYYWSVQAIDHHFQGGSFARRDSFIVPDPLDRDLPDLLVESAGISPLEIAYGAQIKLDLIIGNRGFDSSPISQLVYYLSEDVRLDSNDIKLDSTYLPKINSFDQLVIQDTFLFIPENADILTGGSYFIIFSLDDVNDIVEYIESNNLYKLPLLYDPKDPEFIHDSTELYIPFDQFSDQDEKESVEYRFEFSNPVAVQKIQLQIQGITSNFDSIQEIPVSNLEVINSNGRITEVLEHPLFEADSQGLRYRMILSDSIYSPWLYTYRQYVGKGLAITNLNLISNQTIWNKIWNRKAAYNLISIPIYSDANTSIPILDVLSDDLGLPDPKHWRIVSISPIPLGKGKINYLQYEEKGFTDFEIGKGQFLIITDLDQSYISSNSGKSPIITPSTPFEIVLERGWNLIGNPYNFNISWDSVETYNSIEFETVYTFNTRFIPIDDPSIENKWRRFEGLLVWAEEAHKIRIPINMDPTIQSAGAKRIQSNHSEISTSNNWQFSIDIFSDTERIQKTSIGMNPTASIGVDRMDRLAAPISDKSIPQASVYHPDHIWGYLEKDIVNPQDNYSWFFEFGKISKNEIITLKWIHPNFADKNHTLVLIDENGKQWINMKNQNHCQIDLSVSQKYQITFLDESLFVQYAPPIYFLGAPYPNPLHYPGTLVIPYGIPNGEEFDQGKLDILNVHGQVIKQFLITNPQGGVKFLKWDGRSENGEKVPTGIYFIRFWVPNRPVDIRKIIIQ
ncbi:MAG: FG-GAP-like repeat-containing protein [Bacteroidota bacterium]